MKPFITLSLVLSSLFLVQGCASTPTERDPANSNCRDISTNSEDHHDNNCDGQQGTNTQQVNNMEQERGVNPRR